MHNVLIIGATRGLGAALVSYYSTQPETRVWATSRSPTAPSESPHNVVWLTSIDLTVSDCGSSLAAGLKSKSYGAPLDTVYITAGYFATEDFSSTSANDGPNWENEIKMYTTSSIAPVFVVQALVTSNLLVKGGKVILLSSESGSITLRHKSEGGGNFGHHGSKAALNMVGKLLSLDLKEKGIAVGIMHPSFMRTEMTKSIGFDKFWDDGGALKPEEAAERMAKFVDTTFSIHHTGEYWAPRGTRDIGTWDPVMGKKEDKETPTQLPW